MENTNKKSKIYKLFNTIIVRVKKVKKGGSLFVKKLSIILQS